MQILRNLRRSAARVLSRGASLVALACAASGCVAAKHYDEARSVAESEAAAHARTRARLEASLTRIRTLEADLARRDQALSAGASAVEESKLATTVATKEREAAVQLVDQLRSELARTGEHLTTFTHEKRDLEQALLLAEQRLQAIELAGKNLGELVGATRDLALELRTPLEGGALELVARDGKVILVVPAAKLFVEKGDSLVVEAAPVLGAVSKVSAAHPSLRVGLAEPSGSAESAGRLERLAAALRERGVSAERLVISAVQPPPAPVADAPAASPATSDGEAPSSVDAAPEAEPAREAPVAPPADVHFEIAFLP